MEVENFRQVRRERPVPLMILGWRFIFELIP